MKKVLITAAILSFVLAAPAAFAADTEYKSETNVSKDKDGDMKADTTTTSTDAAGTTQKDEKKVTVDQKDNGDFKKTTEVDSKTDPKGLMNSTKSSTKDTVEKKDGKVTTEHTKKVNGDTVEDTKSETNTTDTDK